MAGKKITLDEEGISAILVADTNWKLCDESGYMYDMTVATKTVL